MSAAALMMREAGLRFRLRRGRLPADVDYVEGLGFPFHRRFDARTCRTASTCWCWRQRQAGRRGQSRSCRGAPAGRGDHHLPELVGRRPRAGHHGGRRLLRQVHLHGADGACAARGRPRRGLDGGRNLASLPDAGHWGTAPRWCWRATSTSWRRPTGARSSCSIIRATCC